METNPPDTNPVQCSCRFNRDDADLTIYSADNVLFRIHSKNLEANTGAFPPSGPFLLNEAVYLPESCATLELLFQFVYPERHPTLERLELEELSLLAEAVEKYEVFPALFVCHYRMGKFLFTNPLELMIYAGRHIYHDYLDDAAPRVMGGDLKAVTRRIPDPTKNSIDTTDYGNRLIKLLSVIKLAIRTGVGVGTKEIRAESMADWEQELSP